MPAKHTDLRPGDHVTNGMLIMRVKRSSEAGVVCSWDKGRKHQTFAPFSLEKVNVGNPMRRNPIKRHA